MNVRALGVIPARYASQRFPGKPLALIGGRPMIQRVYEAAIQSRSLTRVIVATDDRRIADVVSQFGGECELTSLTHETGTDRVAEVSRRHPEYDVVANIQGDQPFVNAEIIDSLLRPFSVSDDVEMTTVGCPMDLKAMHGDPNAVKVICDMHMNAIYFSRAPVPFFKTPSAAPVYHHLGLYAFSAKFLAAYSGMSQTPLEICEGLEQLRVLEHGHRIRVSLIDSTIAEVNTPGDLDLANSLVGDS